jgi:hypothetical protein
MKVCRTTPKAITVIAYRTTASPPPAQAKFLDGDESLFGKLVNIPEDSSSIDEGTDIL